MNRKKPIQKGDEPLPKRLHVSKAQKRSTSRKLLSVSPEAPPTDSTRSSENNHSPNEQQMNTPLKKKVPTEEKQQLTPKSRDKKLVASIQKCSEKVIQKYLIPEDQPSPLIQSSQDKTGTLDPNFEPKTLLFSPTRLNKSEEAFGSEDRPIEVDSFEETPKVKVPAGPKVMFIVPLKKSSTPNKRYNAYEDWRILESVKFYTETNGPKHLTTIKTWEKLMDPSTGLGLLRGTRAADSMRERYKKQLKKMSSEDAKVFEDFVQSHSQEEMQMFAIVFAREDLELKNPPPECFIDHPTSKNPMITAKDFIKMEYNHPSLTLEKSSHNVVNREENPPPASLINQASQTNITLSSLKKNSEKKMKKKKKKKEEMSESTNKNLLPEFFNSDEERAHTERKKNFELKRQGRKEVQQKRRPYGSKTSINHQDDELSHPLKKVKVTPNVVLEKEEPIKINLKNQSQKMEVENPNHHEKPNTKPQRESQFSNSNSKSKPAADDYESQKLLDKKTQWKQSIKIDYIIFVDEVAGVRRFFENDKVLGATPKGEKELFSIAKEHNIPLRQVVQMANQYNNLRYC